MPLLYIQPLAHRFGVELQQCLRSNEWTEFDAAVAWARQTGTRHVLPNLRQLLQRGGKTRIVVGVDIENTSKEGLEDLLSLDALGAAETYVHHNEYGVTFHPKVYLFSNATNARLIIGSNNLTEAGLFTNTEAGLQADALVNDQVIIDVRGALAAWSDPAGDMSKRLTADFLDELVEEGYVLSEATLKSRRRRSEASRKRNPSGHVRKKLFGTKTITAPAVPGVVGGGGRGGTGGSRIAGGIPVGFLNVRGYPHPILITNVLLMRIRTARGTQTQVPLSLYNSGFFNGLSRIVSDHDGVVRAMSITHPERGGGGDNTCKLEIPESRGMADPVLRLERSSGGVRYQCFDAATSIQGRQIVQALEAGRTLVPPLTVLTKPTFPARSTWYRFI